MQRLSPTLLLTLQVACIITATEQVYGLAHTTSAVIRLDHSNFLLYCVSFYITVLASPVPCQTVFLET